MRAAHKRLRTLDAVGTLQRNLAARLSQTILKSGLSSALFQLWAIRQPSRSLSLVSELNLSRSSTDNDPSHSRSRPRQSLSNSSKCVSSESSGVGVASSYWSCAFSRTTHLAACQNAVPTKLQSLALRSLEPVIAKSFFHCLSSPRKSGI